MRRIRRLAAVVVTGLATLAAALPAGADTSPVTVSLQGSSGSRQFYVEDLSGSPLSSLDLGHGGAQPFRVRVTDTGFATTSSGFQVSAVMNNLYLYANNAYAYGVKIPSSAVSLSFPTSPLTSLGVSFPYLPLFSLSGTVPSCASLATLNPAVLGSIVTNPAAVPLCALLGASGRAVSGVSVNGLEQTITPAINAVADLPVALSGPSAGAFSNADYGNGIGNADAAGAAGAPAATSKSVMTGSPGLSAALTSLISSAFSGLPLTTVNDAGAAAPLAGAVAALQGSANATLATLGNDLALLASATQQSAILNTLTATLNAPNLSGIQSLTGSYVAFPSVVSQPSAPQPGTYKGTLTLTFVQT